MAKRSPENQRRRLIEEQRKKAHAAERRKTVLTILISTLIGAGLIGSAVYFGQKGKSGSDGKLAEVGVAATEAACLDPKEEPIPKDATDSAVKHTAKNGDHVDYELSPPTSGRHNPTPLPVGAKKYYSRDENPPPERAVHNLEHGYVVVWYDNKATDEQIKVLEDAADAAEGKFLIVPWTRDDFPDDKHVVLTAWSEKQQCGEVSGAVMQKFLDDFGGAAGKAPEKNAI